MEANSNCDSNDEVIHSPCPVTILSGFLGSGKTTLIQHILKSPDHGKRIAVIENEFGEGLAIESLIARDGIDPGSGSLQDLIELPNGCVCCTVKDSLLEVTEEAARQIAYADRILLNKVDLLQPSSEGNPGTTPTNEAAATSRTTNVLEVERAIRKIHPTAPILRTSFSKVPNLDWILDANCFSGFDRLEEVEISLKDAALTSDTTSTSHDHCHEHHHEHGDGHDCSECCQHDETTDNHDHGHHDHDHGHHEHSHTTSIFTVAFEHSGSVDVKKLNAWLAEILWPNQDETDKVLTAMLYQPEHDASKPNEHQANHESNTEQQIFRIKGIISVHSSDDFVWEGGNCGDAYDVAPNAGVNVGADSNTTGPSTAFLDPRRFIVQSVHDLWDIQPVTSTDLYWQPEENRVGKIVVIGKSLREADLKASFEACFVPP
eukprot:jgi/Psemu1/254861/estExt_Genewise1Plus.C_1200022